MKFSIKDFTVDFWIHGIFFIVLLVSLKISRSRQMCASKNRDRVHFSSPDWQFFLGLFYDFDKIGVQTVNFWLKIQSGKLYNNKYMIAST